jgi:hypothetical protein
MESEMNTVRIFKSEELIFDENETREIFKFFFPNKQTEIDSAIIDDRLRGYSQGLLVMAVDLSYRMGFIEALYRSFYLKPLPKSMTKIIKKLGTKAFIHWFKYATAKDLTDIKIYESIRVEIQRGLRSEVEAMLNGLVMNQIHISEIAQSSPIHPIEVWGASILS